MRFVMSKRFSFSILLLLCTLDRSVCPCIELYLFVFSLMLYHFYDTWNKIHWLFLIQSFIKICIWQLFIFECLKCTRHWIGGLSNKQKIIASLWSFVIVLSEQRSLWCSYELPHIVDNIDVVFFSLLEQVLCFSEDNLAVTDVSEWGNSTH